jgi:hypothetical protein
MDYYDLLNEVESEWLDFKQEFHKNNAELVHDIISLANSKSTSDRYLVFGVAEKNGKVEKIIGIENDPNRKKLQQINNLLYDSNFNNIPELDLTEIDVDGHELAILKIKNSFLKPFFLLTDKKDGKVTVRAGVAYSRLGDSNTPINGSPKDKELEQMWRERFKLDLKPIERFSYLLDEIDEWVSKQENEIYHSQFPEFTIVEKEDPDGKYKEPIESWSQGFPDPSFWVYCLDLVYQGRVLESFFCAYLDGGRYFLPFPDRKNFNEDRKKYKTVYYVIKGSLKHKLLNLMLNHKKWNNGFYDRRLPGGRYYHMVDTETEISPDKYLAQVWGSE